MKNILLIGGSYGIGLALAKLLQEENNVWIASRTSENLQNFSHVPFDAAADV